MLLIGATPASRMGRKDGGISAPFGISPGYGDGKTFHHGIDEYWLNDDPTGSRKVFAAAAGTVRRTYWDDTMGWCVEVDHAPGVFTRYCHMAGVAVKAGDQVTTDNYLGPMGNTGTAAHGQYHLHFELWINNVRVDPAPYFSKDLPSSGSAGTDYGYGLTADAQLQAQRALNILGRYTGTIDGVFGPASVTAFQQYLKDTGHLPASYKVDGLPGPRYGKAIQTLAAQHGYTGPIDGKPGPMTSTAIIAWALATAPVPADPSTQVSGPELEPAAPDSSAPESPAPDVPNSGPDLSTSPEPDNPVVTSPADPTPVPEEDPMPAPEFTPTAAPDTGTLGDLTNQAATATGNVLPDWVRKYLLWPLIAVAGTVTLGILGYYFGVGELPPKWVYGLTGVEVVVLPIAGVIAMANPSKKASA